MRPISSRPATIAEIVGAVERVVRADRRVTINEVPETVPISYCSAHHLSLIHIYYSLWQPSSPIHLTCSNHSDFYSSTIFYNIFYKTFIISLIKVFILFPSSLTFFLIFFKSSFVAPKKHELTLILIVK